MVYSLLSIGLVSLIAATNAAPLSKPLVVRENAPKRGLAYNDPNLTKLFGDKVSWCYNWGSYNDVAGSNLEFVPMLHGSGPEFTNVWNDNVEKAIAAGSRNVLSFNEPDQCGGGGACMQDVGATIRAHQQWIQPLADKHPDVKIGAPAVTNGVKDPATGNDMGLPYLSRFLTGCQGCRIDFIVVHWYDSASNFAYFKKHIEDAYAAGGNRPIWITEFAPIGDDAQKQAFLAEALPFLDSLAYVHRYAYHYAAPNVLVSAAGNSLSALGSTYIGI
jgi:hypothetical protein